MFLKIGHRGAAGLEPENTLMSFQKALDLGVDIIELDVHCLKTGRIIVIHDKKLDRTTDGKGYLREKGLSYIKNLNAGKGEKIPLLEEALDLINKKAIVNIELKGEKTAKPVAEIIKKYVKEKNWDYNDFFISSFNCSRLKKIKKILPKVKIGLLIKTNTKEYLKAAKNLNVFSINVPFNLIKIRKNIIKKLQGEGFRVFVWTVNKKRSIKRLKKMGVDGIITDFPNKL